MKSKLDNQNSYNSLSFMAEALIPAIDKLKETNKPQHKLKFHINKMLEELEKLSVEKYRAFRYADQLQKAKSIAVNMYNAGSSENQIVKYIAKEFNEDIGQTIKVFMLKGLIFEKRPHSYEDIMVITDEAYSVLADIITNRRANEVVSLITLYKMIVEEGISLDEIRTEYSPIKK